MLPDSFSGALHAIFVLVAIVLLRLSLPPRPLRVVVLPDSLLYTKASAPIPFTKVIQGLTNAIWLVLFAPSRDPKVRLYHMAPVRIPRCDLNSTRFALRVDPSHDARGCNRPPDSASAPPFCVDCKSLVDGENDLEGGRPEMLLSPLEVLKDLDGIRVSHRVFLYVLLASGYCPKKVTYQNASPLLHLWWPWRPFERACEVG